MKRAEFPRENTFPYLNSGPATNTDGSLGASDPKSDVKIAAPNEYLPESNRGRIIKSAIGDTDYVDTNTTQHGVFAGNS